MPYLNRCIWAAASAGTGSFVVSAAAQNGYTPAQCANPAVIDGGLYDYFAVDPVTGAHEEGKGTFTVATSTLTRATIRNSSNSGSAVNFVNAPVVYMGGPTASDLLGLATANMAWYVAPYGSDTNSGLPSGIVATTAATATTSATITVASVPSFVVANMMVWDQTTGAYVGKVSSMGSGTITLNANAVTPVGSGDTLVFAAPFATTAHAEAVASSYNWNVQYAPTIYVAGGAFTGVSDTLPALFNCSSGGTIVGNGANVIASTSAATTTSSPTLTFTAAPAVVAGMVAIDLLTGKYVGVVSSKALTTVTLAANAASAVASGDTLIFLLVAGAAATSTATATSSPTLSFSATPAFVQAGMQVMDLTTLEFVGAVLSTTGTTATLTANAATAVGSGDMLAFYLPTILTDTGSAYALTQVPFSEWTLKGIQTAGTYGSLFQNDLCRLVLANFTIGGALTQYAVAQGIFADVECYGTLLGVIASSMAQGLVFTRGFCVLDDTLINFARPVTVGTSAFGGLFNGDSFDAFIAFDHATLVDHGNITYGGGAYALTLFNGTKVETDGATTVNGTAISRSNLPGGGGIYMDTMSMFQPDLGYLLFPQGGGATATGAFFTNSNGNADLLFNFGGTFTWSTTSNAFGTAGTVFNNWSANANAIVAGAVTVFEGGFPYGAASFAISNLLTYTSQLNSEYGIFDFQNTTNVLSIGTLNEGTGVARPFQFLFGGTKVADYGVTTSTSWTFQPIDIVAGTATVPPLKLTSGTNLTTAAAGAIEFDGTSFYATSVASSRQVVATEQFQNLSGTRTLTSNTSAQAIFNATTNGAITLAASTTYEFEMMVAVSGFSSSAHTVSLGFGGTATLTSIGYFYDAQAGSTLAGPTAALTGFVASASATAVIASSTTTGLVLRVRGTIRVNAAGTLIPQLTQGTASAAAVVQANSFIRLWPVGSNTVTNVGDWS